MVANENLDDLSYGVRHGLINIRDMTDFGDIHTDGNIDIRDAVKLARYLSGKIELNRLEMLVSDVHRDNVVDIRDAIKLSQYLAGFENIILGQ